MVDLGSVSPVEPWNLYQGAEIVAQAVDAWNKRDFRALEACYDKECVVYDPAYTEPLRGFKAIKEDVDNFLRGFPDIKFDVTRLVCEGDTVACEMQLSGTHTGPLTGPVGTLPPTNKRIEVKGAMFVRCGTDGKIIEERRYYDAAGMLAQLGLRMVA